jgi:hypothetical protein
MLDDIDISGFKRVRIHNKQGRVRLHVFNRQLPPSWSKDNTQSPLNGTDVNMTDDLLTSFGSGENTFLSIEGPTAFAAPETDRISSTPGANTMRPGKPVAKHGVPGPDVEATMSPHPSSSSGMRLYRPKKTSKYAKSPLAYVVTAIYNS